MTAPIPTFAQYVASLGRLTPHVDPTLITPESEQIRAAAQSLANLTTPPADSVTTTPSDEPANCQAHDLVKSSLILITTQPIRSMT